MREPTASPVERYSWVMAERILRARLLSSSIGKDDGSSASSILREMSVLKAAVVQLCSTADVERNLRASRSALPKSAATRRRACLFAGKICLLSSDEKTSSVSGTIAANQTGRCTVTGRSSTDARWRGQAAHLVLGGLPEVGQTTHRGCLTAAFTFARRKHRGGVSQDPPV